MLMEDGGQALIRDIFNVTPVVISWRTRYVFMRCSLGQIIIFSSDILLCNFELISSEKISEWSGKFDSQAPLGGFQMGALHRFGQACVQQRCSHVSGLRAPGCQTICAGIQGGYVCVYYILSGLVSFHDYLRLPSWPPVHLIQVES